MTYNLIAYIIFLSIIGFTTFYVGWVFYSNGRHYLNLMVPDSEKEVEAINKILLIGYYLLNMGYAAASLYFWNQIYSLAEMLEVLSLKTSLIILGLAFMHYFNLTWIYIYHNNLIKKTGIKS